MKEVAVHDWPTSSTGSLRSCSVQGGERAEKGESLGVQPAGYLNQEEDGGVALGDGRLVVALLGRLLAGEVATVYGAAGHVAETAPFGAPPLDLDDNEHAIRRISTPLITMGLCRLRRSKRVTVLM